MRVFAGGKSPVMRVFAETPQGPGVQKCGSGSIVDVESQSSEHPLPKRSKHSSIGVGKDMSEDSRPRQASGAQHLLHATCEYYHMDSDREGSIAVRKAVAKPTHYRVRTKSKSERLFSRKG